MPGRVATTPGDARRGAPQHEVMQRFEPSYRRARRDAALAAGASFLVAPVLFWWRGFSDLVAGALITLFTFAVLAGRGLYLLRFRGLDTLLIDEFGVRLSCKRTSAEFRWEDLHRVYRFGENLVFESNAPRRRYNFMLAGHEHQQNELVAALVSRARTMDLRWVSELT